MEPKIRHFSEEEIRKFKEELPESKPKEWALIDPELDGIMSFHDTEEEAKSEQEEWRQRDLVEDAFRDWVIITADETGIERDKVIQFIRESL